MAFRTAQTSEATMIRSIRLSFSNPPARRARPGVNGRLRSSVSDNGGRAKLLWTILALALLGMAACRADDAKNGARLRFAISFTQEQNKEPLDGRVLLVISTNGEPEPRFQITDDADTQQIFGIDVEGLQPGSA